MRPQRAQTPTRGAGIRQEHRHAPTNTAHAIAPRKLDREGPWKDHGRTMEGHSLSEPVRIHPSLMTGQCIGMTRATQPPRMRELTERQEEVLCSSPSTPQTPPRATIARRIGCGARPKEPLNGEGTPHAFGAQRMDRAARRAGPNAGSGCSTKTYPSSNRWARSPPASPSSQKAARPRASPRR